MTPDLQRIVETLKACRERYRVTKLPGEEVWRLIDACDGSTVVAGYRVRCQEVFDALCAKAMVGAIREPDVDVLMAGREAAKRVRLSGLSGMTIDAQVRAQCARETATWRAMCDAILGETQP
jgi:hypothetical protein